MEDFASIGGHNDSSSENCKTSIICASGSVSAEVTESYEARVTFGETGVYLVTAQGNASIQFPGMGYDIETVDCSFRYAATAKSSVYVTINNQPDIKRASVVTVERIKWMEAPCSQATNRSHRRVSRAFSCPAQWGGVALYDSGSSLTGSSSVALSQPVTRFSAIEVFVVNKYLDTTYKVGSVRIPHPQVGVTYRFATGGNSSGAPLGTEVTIDSASQLSCMDAFSISQVIGHR